MNKIIFIIASLLLLSFQTHAKDSTKVKPPYEHKVKRAILWSSFIPGAGQIYNEVGYRKIPQKKHRAWWKVPIIYGGLGVTGYYWYTNYDRAKMFKEEIQFRRDYGSAAILHPEFAVYSTESQLINGIYINDGFDYHAQKRDLFTFVFAGVWALNVIEALVDAHFVTFDVSSDLSFNYYPVLMDFNTPGIGLSLNFN